MKKKVLFLSLSVLAIAAVVTVKSVNTKSGMSSLMTQNIEALTLGEDVSGRISCYDNGSIYCPLTNTSVYKRVIISEY